MKVSILIIIQLVFFINTFSQDKKIQEVRDSILNEGMLLYKLEKASWHSTDIFLYEFSDLRNKMKGYISYLEAGEYKTAFYNKFGDIIVTIKYKSEITPDKAKTTNKERKATDLETNLIAMRQEVKNLMETNVDTFFRFYEDLAANIVPVIDDKGNKKVFVLSGLLKSDMFLIGNDYVLLFDDENKLISRKKLHEGLIHLNDENYIKRGKDVETIHAHRLKDQPYMTSTDICNYMLYKDIFKIYRHSVVSENYISIFDTEKETFMILPSSIFNKDAKEPEADLSDQKCIDNLNWLKRNNIRIKTLDKANPSELIYNCDSFPMMKEVIGDTTTLYTIAGKSYLDTTFVSDWVKDENFGLLTYISGVNYQCNLEFISLKKNVFLHRNDSLYEMEQFRTISQDSVGKLYKKMIETKNKDLYLNLIKKNTYYKPKLIFHPDIFINGVYEGNIKKDKITMKEWIIDGRKYYRITISNKLGETKTEYKYIIDQDYKFIEYDGCHSDIIRQLK